MKRSEQLYALMCETGMLVNDEYCGKYTYKCHATATVEQWQKFIITAAERLNNDIAGAKEE